MDHNFKQFGDDEIKTSFESLGAELIEFMNEDSNRDKFEENTCKGLQRLMTKIFSPNYSVLSSKAHKNDKQVVYDLVNLAAIFKTRIDLF